MSRGTVCGLKILLKFWIVLGFLQKPLAWFSNFYLRVQSKNSGRSILFILLFRIFFGFWAKNFYVFWPKTSRSFQNYLLRVQRNSLWFEIFKKFWIVLDLLQKPLAWFSKFYLRVQSKNCGRKIFFFFFLEFYRILSEKFFRLLAKKLQEVFRTTFYVSRRKVCGLKFFWKFWIVLDFLQKPLAWFSKFCLRVQSTNSGRNNFFNSSFQSFFSDFERNIFQTFDEKPSRSCQIYLLRVQRNSLWLEIFFLKFWIVLGFLQEPLAWFSIFYLRVQSKNSGRNNFFNLLFRVFSDFERKIFQTSGRKTLRSFQNYLLRVQRNSLWLGFFLKFSIVSAFMQEPLAWFSIFYLRVQSKNSGRNSFFILLFRIFSDFERKFFQIFGQKLQDVFKTTFYVSRGTVCGLKFFKKFWIVLDLLQKPLAWFSKFYLRVQSKNCGRKIFFFFFLEFYRILSEKFFRLLAKKLQEVFRTTFYVSRRKVCGLKFFLKFWVVLVFLQNPLAWFSNFYLRVQSKNSGRNNFFNSSFQSFFSDFERNIFQTFDEKPSRSCQIYLLRVQRNSLWLEIFF